LSDPDCVMRKLRVTEARMYPTRDSHVPQTGACMCPTCPRRHDRAPGSQAAFMIRKSAILFC